MTSSRSVAYMVLSLVALWGYLVTFDRQSHLPALPADVRASALDYPVEVDGRTAGTRGELEFLVQRGRPGDAITLSTAAGPRTVRLVRAFPPVHDVITLLCAVLFWVIGVFTFVSRIERTEVRDFYWGTLLYGFAFTTGGVYHPVHSGVAAYLPPIGRIASLALIPAFLVHVALVFPRRRPILDRHPRITPVLFAAATLLIAAEALLLVRYVMVPGPGTFRGLTAALRIGDLWLIAAVAAGGYLLYQGSQSAELAREKQQIKWLWWGITVGVWPFLVFYVLPRLFGVEPLLPLQVVRLCALAIPVSFALTIVRYRFLDIDVIIRRSLIYGVLAGILVGVYLFLTALVGRQVERLVPEVARYSPIVAAAVSIALFNPTRRVVGAWVDRTFFKIRYVHEAALKEFRGRIAGVVGQEELAHRVRDFVEQCLRPRNLAVVLYSGESAGLTAIPPAFDAAAACRRILEDPAELDAPRARRNATSLPEVERDSLGEEFDPLGVLVIQPCTVRGRLLGLILLGEKESERRYIEEDLRLLAGVAGEAGQALERMMLVQEAAREAVERRRLDELNRLKSDFLSRVAHDLRTPVTAISWSADNLLDGLAGPLEPRATEYVAAMRTSARQLGRLVTNLLDLSRLELGVPGPPAGPVSFDEVVREAVAGLKPVADSMGVTVGAGIPPGLPPVRAVRDKAVEMVQNLLDNAIKYSPPGGAVELRVEPEAASGTVLLSVRDHGPGIPEADLERIFERFVQGAPSPRQGLQQGFGIGLHVVRTYARLFGGSVTARNHAGGGAEFLCRLPVWEAEGKDVA